MNPNENFEEELDEDNVDEDIELSPFDKIQDAIIGLKDSLEEHYNDLEEEERIEIIQMIDDRIGGNLSTDSFNSVIGDNEEEDDEETEYDELFEEEDDEESIDEDME